MFFNHWVSITQLWYKSTNTKLRSGLNHGFETSVRKFQEQLNSRLSALGYAAEEIPAMVNSAEYLFREWDSPFWFQDTRLKIFVFTFTARWKIQPASHTVSLTNLPQAQFRLMFRRNELKQSFQSVLHVVTEAIKGIKSTLEGQGYEAPTVIFLSRS